ncbi:MAG: L,D-transpeptidase [Gemmatimonadetes bacterium]|nr:L,D-transpeptidase [Gemmatimonadota bacterium]
MKPSFCRTPINRLSAFLCSAAFAAGATPAAAQDAALAFSPAAVAAAANAVSAVTGENDASSSALARGRYAVVIDVEQNRLFFKQGDLTLWSAPVGTGTGLRLQAGEQEWKFATPDGTFQVQYKEQNPVWYAADWYFVENGLPIPPPADPKRSFPGALGAAAMYIGRDVAIHGTNKPELLGQRVSHGCIRLSNKDALRLYHNVQVGTEVVIVGGESVPERVVTPERLQAQKAKATFDPARPAPADPTLDGWKALPTRGLLVVLDNELRLKKESTRWPEVAALLLDRGVKAKDDAALAGLMNRADRLPNEVIRREYATLLADAFARSAFRTLETLSRLDEERGAAAGRAIVEATMNLYHGDFNDAAAPWPTARVPRDVLPTEALEGWLVLAEAEKALR